MNIARLKNTKAFTLIELIVVIVILGILVAIGAFAYQSLIKSSRTSAAEKTGNQIAKSIAAAGAAASPAKATSTFALADVRAAIGGTTATGELGALTDEATKPTTTAGAANSVHQTGTVVTYKNGANCVMDIVLTGKGVGAAPSVANVACP